jgi:hypothetical protein
MPEPLTKVLYLLTLWTHVLQEHGCAWSIKRVGLLHTAFIDLSEEDQNNWWTWSERVTVYLSTEVTDYGSELERKIWKATRIARMRKRHDQPR